MLHTLFLDGRSSIQMPTYLLSKHVHLCVSGSQVVLLDLKRDQYSILGPEDTQHLATLVKGWPPSEHTESRTSKIGAVDVINDLLKKNILTTTPREGKAANQTILDRPNRTLFEDDHERPHIGIVHFLALLQASAAASMKLKYLSIENTIRNVSHAKSRYVGIRHFDLGRSRDLMTAYYHLRPFVFSAHNACLLDSLTVILFFARFNLYPNWVFGVQTSPFEAHCWVQQDQYVLNDTVERVGCYSPIMVV